jgi:hypothetical protein
MAWNHGRPFFIVPMSYGPPTGHDWLKPDTVNITTARWHSKAIRALCGAWSMAGGEEVTWNKAHLEMIEKNQWSEHHQIPSWLMFFCKIFSEWREQQRYGKRQEFLWETWVWSAGLPWNDRLISRENHLKQRDPWPAWIVSSSHQSYFFSFSGGLQFCGTKQLQPPEEAVLWSSICWWIPFPGRIPVILSGMGQRWEGDNILDFLSTAQNHSGFTHEKWWFSR